METLIPTFISDGALGTPADVFKAIDAKFIESQRRRFLNLNTELSYNTVIYDDAPSASVVYSTTPLSIEISGDAYTQEFEIGTPSSLIGLVTLLNAMDIGVFYTNTDMKIVAIGAIKTYGDIKQDGVAVFSPGTPTALPIRSTDTDVFRELALRATRSGTGSVTLDWTLNGNTLDSEMFIGTISNHRFPIRVNNVEKWSQEVDGSIKRSGNLFSQNADGSATTWGVRAGNASPNSGTYIGYEAGLVSIGSNCTFIGESAGILHTTGASCIYIGTNAGSSNLIGNQCVYIGVGSGANATNQANTYIGYSSGNSQTTGVSSVMIGEKAGRNYFSGIGNISTSNASIYIGHGAGDGVSDGSFNIYIGQQTGWNGLHAAYNIIIGNAVVMASYGGGDIVNSFSTNTIQSSIAIGNLTTISANHQLVIGGPTHYIDQEQHYWSASGVHGVYYRTSTAEGNQVADMGSVAYINNGSLGWIEYKATNSGFNTGWVTVGSGTGSGTVTSFSFTNGGGFTGSVSNATTTPTLSLTLQNAAADGSTKGQAAFTASDFNSSSGVISIDYTNGQTADGSTKGFLTSADWNTFNGKISSQWVTTGSDIYYDAGNVGIGGAPSYTLDVIGDHIRAAFDDNGRQIDLNTNNSSLILDGLSSITTIGDAHAAGSSTTIKIDDSFQKIRFDAGQGIGFGKDPTWPGIDVLGYSNFDDGVSVGADLNVTGNINGSTLSGSSPVFTDVSNNLVSTGTVPVAKGGTGTGTAGITAFNNITGYTASGATGTTSTNLMFSGSPTIVTPTIASFTNATHNHTNAAGGGQLAATTALSDYVEVKDADISGVSTITWDGTPPTTLTGRYSYTRIGNIVWGEIRLEYANAGATNTTCTITLPTGMPTPETLTGVGTETSIACYGALATTPTATPAASRAWMSYNGAAFQFNVVAGSMASRIVIVSFQYHKA